MTMNESSVSRRTFVKGSLAGLALAGAAGSTALYGCAPKDEKGAASEGAGASTDQISWSQCNVNCGGNCVFQWHSQDGKIVYMESDNTGDVDLQARACLRGRSMRRWINSPDRLTKPMKRVGKRGEGKFEEISWDEAIDTIASELKRVIDTYGNDAIYVNYATGMYSTTGKQPGLRLLGLLGGYINQAYDYSTHMLQVALPFMYGSKCSPYDNVHASSFSEAERASDLVVMFGNSPAETRMGGANAVWDFAKVRESVTGRGGKIVNIDYRMNESCSGHPDEWLPIRPGTDAALASAIAHEWIANDQVDKGFLDEYCVGYDEDTMPESAKGQNKSYKDYIMGTGYDMVEKTAEWAAPITGIPAERIKQLAADIAAAEAPFICQGWGPQRHTNGEDTSRAICMLPVLIGKIGLPGTNTGQREAEPPTYLVGSLPFENPIKTAIPVYQWINAVDHGKEMTVTNAGIVGADKLNNDIKFLWNYAGNCITNQHGDINYTHDVLADESKLEFILVWDTVMTDSAKYADILLPDAMRSEQLNMQTQGYSEYYTAVVVGGPAQEAPGECRSSYDVCADIADKFGKKDAFTEGKTQEDWIKELYEGGAWSDAGDGTFTSDAFAYHVSLGCQHCAMPACMAKCPQGAIEKDTKTGLVHINQEKCTGVGACVETCPYNVPIVDKALGKGVKCDGCADRVAEGKSPICVEACPLRALEFGDIEELRAKHEGTVAGIAPMPSPDETTPSIAILPCPAAKEPGDTTGAIANEKEVTGVA